MSSIYSLGTSGTSSFMDTFFGTSSSSSSSSTSSLLSSFGDYQMIKTGAYKKALKAYYATTSDSTSSSNTISGSGTTDTTANLSTLKSSAKSLYDTANKLKKADYSDSAKAEDLLDTAKDFVDEYNSVVNTTKNMNSYSILQTTSWGTDRIKISSALLDEVGISVDSSNNLSLDEDKFKEAKISDLKSLFSGSGSLADYIGGKASTLYNQSTNQLAVNQGKLTYTSYGSLF